MSAYTSLHMSTLASNTIRNKIITLSAALTAPLISALSFEYQGNLMHLLTARTRNSRIFPNSIVKRIEKSYTARYEQRCFRENVIAATIKGIGETAFTAIVTWQQLDTSRPSARAPTCATFCMHDQLHLSSRSAHVGKALLAYHGIEASPGQSSV